MVLTRMSKRLHAWLLRMWHRRFETSVHAGAVTVADGSFMLCHVIIDNVETPSFTSVFRLYTDMTQRRHLYQSSYRL